VLDYQLTEEQQMIRDLARTIADNEVRPVAAEYDRSGEFPWPVVEKIAEAGLFGVFIDEAYGGLAGDSRTMNMVLVTEELSKACGGISLAEVKQRFLPAIAAGERLAAFALTEPQAGSDAAGIRTTAVRDGDHYVVNGLKQWITNGGDAEIYTVVVMTNPEKGARGASALVIEKDTPGFSFGKKEDKMGIRASSTRELVFEDCRVPVENLIGREGTGFITAMKTFDASRPGVGAQALGIAQGALDLAVDWSISRRQFGSPVSSFQGLRFLLADMATKVEASRALIYATAKHIDANPKARSTIYSAMSKCFASDVAMSVTTDAVQVYGGSGYMRDYPIEKYMRDAKITQIYEGTNQIQREEIGKILIGEHIQAQDA
jgi:alkylation response protein AidB-like acyl-CoA dehydrogenase